MISTLRFGRPARGPFLPADERPASGPAKTLGVFVCTDAAHHHAYAVATPFDRKSQQQEIAMFIRAYAAKTTKGKLEAFDFDPGPLGPNEVEVAVSHCGICHSDLAMIDNDFGMAKYPLIPGHEITGTIAAMGEQVRGLKTGQRVGVGWQCGSCGLCEWCSTGHENFCAKEVDTVVNHFGGWAERVRAQAKFAVPLPEALDASVAGPLMCAGATVFSPMMHFGVTSGMRTAVVGIGGLGHLAVQFLAKMGCEVTAISSSHDKDEAVRKLGAHHFIATRGTDELKKAAGSFDFIISTVSAAVDWSEYVNALRPQGRLCIVGLPLTPVQIPIFGIVAAEKSVTGGRCGSPSDTAKMLDFAARHKVLPVCEHFALADVNKALDYVRSGKARYRAVLTM
jgi:uncharacterized zinc-type alcohol dehydrogenase-like protein